MSIADHSRKILTSSIAQVAQSVGFEALSSRALDILVDVTEERIQKICRIASNLACPNGHINNPVALFEYFGLSPEYLTEFLNKWKSTGPDVPDVSFPYPKANTIIDLDVEPSILTKKTKISDEGKAFSSIIDSPHQSDNISLAERVHGLIPKEATPGVPPNLHCRIVRYEHKETWTDDLITRPVEARSAKESVQCKKAYEETSESSREPCKQVVTLLPRSSSVYDFGETEAPIRFNSPWHRVPPVRIKLKNPVQESSQEQILDLTQKPAQKYVPLEPSECLNVGLKRSSSYTDSSIRKVKKPRREKHSDYSIKETTGNPPLKLVIRIGSKQTNEEGEQDISSISKSQNASRESEKPAVSQLCHDSSTSSTLSVGPLQSSQPHPQKLPAKSSLREKALEASKPKPSFATSTPELRTSLHEPSKARRKQLHPQQRIGLGSSIPVVSVAQSRIGMWICPSCRLPDDGSPMIACDSCDDWYHWPCARVNEEPPPGIDWFCPKCAANMRKQ